MTTAVSNTLNQTGLLTDLTQNIPDQFKDLVSYLNEALTQVQEGSGLTFTGETQQTAEPTLDEPTQSYSSEMLAILLSDLTDKLKKLEEEGAKKALEGDMKSKEELHEKRMKKIEEALEKMEKASKASTAAKVFGWIGAALAVVAAAAAVVATGGAAAPLLAAAIFNVAVMALSEIKVNDKSLMQYAQEGLAKGLQAFNKAVFGNELSDKDANILASIYIAVAVVAVNVTCMLMSGGATAGSSALAIAANITKIGAMIGSGVSMVGQGTAQVTSAAYQYEGAKATADALDIKAQITKLQTMIEQLMDELKAALERADEEMGVIMDMFRSGGDLKEQIIQTQV